MKKTLLSTVAFLGLTAGSMAADLPSYAAPVMVAPVPVFTWTGFYVGVNAGYGWGNDNSRPVDLTNGYFGGGGNDGGFVGGAQLGYNYQIGQFVIGAETDLQYADLGNGSDGYYGYGYNSGSDNEFFGTTRVRAGFAFDRFLAYATGGLAYGDSEFGWTAGAGVEYAFTNNLTARLEGLYVNLDRDDNHYYGVVGVPTTHYGSNDDNEFGLVRLGLNYKFTTY